MDEKSQGPERKLSIQLCGFRLKTFYLLLKCENESHCWGVDFLGFLCQKKIWQICGCHFTTTPDLYQCISMVCNFSFIWKGFLPMLCKAFPTQQQLLGKNVFVDGTRKGQLVSCSVQKIQKSEIIDCKQEEKWPVRWRLAAVPASACWLMDRRARVRP